MDCKEELKIQKLIIDLMIQKIINSFTNKDKKEGKI